jgi:hypothetical protein
MEMLLAESIFGWKQGVALVALIGLIIFYVQYRKRQM